MSAAAAAGPRSAEPRGLAAGLALGLVLLVALCFGRAAGHEFVSLDDPIYLTQNEHVRAGLGSDGVRWAFTTVTGGPWHPLVWLSHMLDVTLFGMAPAGHHLMNVAIHAASAALLFLALRALSGAAWASALAAALFAVHPLRAESVAWAAERKDVLAGLFWMLALYAYAGYVRRGGAWRNLAVVVAMALGLMAKPSIVTLPFVLLLLDVWPLRRLRLEPGAPLPWRALGGLVLEKLPLFALAAAASVLSVLTQDAGGGVASLDQFSLGQRAANTLLAYVGYLRKTLWPVDLAVFYPYPKDFPWWRVGGAAALLLALTGVALAALRRAPYLAVGWLWYVGVLVPMVGLVQVGAQALADRYSYLPSIGLALAAAFGLAHAAERWPRTRRWLIGAAALALTASALVTWRQVGTWRDSRTLYSHAAAVTRDNWLADTNLAWVLATSPVPAVRDGALAVLHAEAAAELTGHRSPEALDTLAAAYAEAGDFAQALAWQRWALRLAPAERRDEFRARLALYEGHQPFRDHRQ